MHGSSDMALQIVHQIKSHPLLINEAFSQIIKQATNCPEQGMCVRIWELFLIIATIFPASPQSILPIQSYLVDHLKTISNLKHLEQIFQLSYLTLIRFTARSSLGITLENCEDHNFILSIPQTIKKQSNVFGVSLYEIMFKQIDEYPHLPLPYIIVQLCETMISRLENNQIDPSVKSTFIIDNENNEKLSYFVNKINANEFDINDPELDIKTIGALIIQWLNDLMEPLIRNESLIKLGVCSAHNSWVHFVNSDLAPLHSVVLAYLIGFIIDIERFKEILGIDSKKLSNIIAVAMLKKTHEDYTGFVKELLSQLIIQWDVSDIYPLPKSLLEK